MGIFGWLKGWFSKESTTDDSYSPGQRRIYRYFNGDKEISADPMVLYKRVMDVGPSLSADIKVSASISRGARGAHASMVKTLREIFSVKSLEEGGLTEQEVCDLFDHFMTYCDDLKKNSSQPATSPEATSPSGPSPSTEEKSPPTAGTSDSGSTEKGSCTGPPTPSPSERESPTTNIIPPTNTSPASPTEREKPAS